jgi:TatD DNase family protein|tara:strand:- start:9682 stop:10467 length:786 start_codon:yes stop_codon:yes gene_type:complete
MEEMIIDIHCHLDHYYFKDDLDKVVDNAKKAGLRIILTAGLNPETNRKVLKIAEKYDIVKPCLGMYPIQTFQKEIEDGNLPLKENKFDVDEEIKFIEENKDKIAGVGEVGLDYSLGEDSGNQKKIFEKMISLAEKIDKPLIVHSRKAEQDCVEVLESSKSKKIIMHCFCGKKPLVKKIIDNGWFLTIPTNIVRSYQFQFTAKEVPITQLFCETDAPFLSPFKDKRNEPAFVAEAYKKLAEIKKMEFGEVVNNVWMNWQNLF